MASGPNPFETLGLPADASKGDIKKAYKKLARKLHPDTNRNDPHAEEKFKRLGKHYQEALEAATNRDAGPPLPATAETSVGEPPPERHSSYDWANLGTVAGGVAQDIGAFLAHVLPRAPRALLVVALLLGFGTAGSWVIKGCGSIIHESQVQDDLKAMMPSSEPCSGTNVFSHEDRPAHAVGAITCGWHGSNYGYGRFNTLVAKFRNQRDVRRWFHAQLPRHFTLARAREGGCRAVNHRAPYRFSGDYHPIGSVACFRDGQENVFVWTLRKPRIGARAKALGNFTRAYRWWRVEAGPKEASFFGGNGLEKAK
jgi:hypothetical protein